MPPKKQEGVARFRVTVPQEVYDRMTVLANHLSIDVPTLVRIMASLQLVQWEHLANPFSMLTPEVQKQVARDWTQQATKMFPEGQHPERLLDEDDHMPMFQPEPEPKVVDRPGVGFRPKGELDEFGSYSLLEDLVAGYR